MTLIEENVGNTKGEPAADETGAQQLPTLTDAAKSAPSEAPVVTGGGMRVMKRNGHLEPVDLNKIVNAIARASEGLLGVDPMRVATRTISALADGASTGELDNLSIRTAAGLIVEEPNYSKLAARCWPQSSTKKFVTKTSRGSPNRSRFPTSKASFPTKCLHSSRQTPRN